MEMVEKDVVNREARKGVQQAAHHREIGADEPAQVGVCRQGGQGEFQHQQGGHQIGHRRAWEGEGQPEEGASQQIKGIRADEVGPQVGVPVPEDVPRPHRVVGHPVKRDLLHIEISVIDEQALVDDQEGEKQQKRHGQRDKKRVPRAALGPP